MINLDIFLVGLLLTSTLTSLASEAVKKILIEYNKTYRANTLVGLVSLITSSIVGGIYVAMSNIDISVHTCMCLFALICLSWLCAMVGYDKVIQAITQFKNYKNNDEH